MKTPIDLFRMVPWLALVLGAIVPGVRSATAADIVAASRPSVALEVNKGSVVSLSQPASTVFVADPEVCDIQMKSPKIVYLMGKRPGNTTLFAIDANENVLANIDVSVSHNISRLRQAIRSLHPNLDVRASSVEGAVVLEGNVGDPSIAEDVRDLASQIAGEKGRVINRLGVSAPTQVNLRVRVAEISRDVQKQLGINWQAVGEMFDIDLAFSFLNPFAGAGVLTDNLGIQGGRGSWDITAVINALEQEGLISVLAEPNLTALSGETASFLAGGEFPILVPDDDRVTIEFKKFGISLAFTPTLTSESRINLHVRPEVSQLTNEGAISLPLGFTGGSIFIPALSVRRAETTVELGSGQSFAIAGLLNNDSSHDVKKVPGLGDVPVLGRLFQSDQFQRNESELVIIVTPYIVRPSKERLPTPVDGFAPPNDLERLFPGGTWKRTSAGAPATVRPDGSRLVGPVGFALE
jgi:pilus assembly protein CpaC